MSAIQRARRVPFRVGNSNLICFCRAQVCQFAQSSACTRQAGKSSFVQWSWILFGVHNPKFQSMLFRAVIQCTSPRRVWAPFCSAVKILLCARGRRDLHLHSAERTERQKQQCVMLGLTTAHYWWQKAENKCRQRFPPKMWRHMNLHMACPLVWWEFVYRWSNAIK